ncbi:MAG: hypothetical protein ACR2JV_03705 [Gaiellales bacterium]
MGSSLPGEGMIVTGVAAVGKPMRHRPPGCDSGAMEFPDIALPRAGGGTVARAALAGRPWLVYLARHPG